MMRNNLNKLYIVSDTINIIIIVCSFILTVTRAHWLPFRHSPRISVNIQIVAMQNRRQFRQ